MKLRFLMNLIGFLSVINLYSQESSLTQLITLPNQQHILFELQRPDTIPVNTLFMPLLFKGEVLPRHLNLLKKDKESHTGECNLYLNDQWLRQSITLDSLREQTKLYVAVQHPYLTRYYINRLPSKKEIEEVEKEAAKSSFVGLFTPEEFKLPERPKEIKGIKERISYWKGFSVANVQFTQNYISDNWHQGGESNISLLSTFNQRMEYRDDKNIQFDNELDWRAGFFSTPSDTMRMFKVSDDQLRLNSKFGYKAFSKWYYTASFEFKTKLFNSYKANSKEMLSSFLTPAEMYFSLGMDFKTKFDSPNIQNLSVFIAPVTYSLKFAVRDNKVDVTRFGIEEGRKTLNQVGSMVKANISYPIIKNILWESRFYYFTTYSNIESEWENSTTFILNRYFSTRLFFIVRYDDRRKLKDENDTFFQWKEFLSLGFTYRW